jgi:hypothetical protein
MRIYARRSPPMAVTLIANGASWYFLREIGWIRRMMNSCSGHGMVRILANRVVLPTLVSS